MASERGRGAQVRLDDDARQYARGGTAFKLIDNVRLKQAAEEAGTAPSGRTPDGSLGNGTAADEEVLAPDGAALAGAGLADTLSGSSTYGGVMTSSRVGIQDGTSAVRSTTKLPAFALSKYISLDYNSDGTGNKWDRGVEVMTTKTAGSTYSCGLTGTVRHQGGTGQMIAIQGRGYANHAEAEVFGVWAYVDATGSYEDAIGAEINLNVSATVDSGWRVAGFGDNNAMGLIITTADSTTSPAQTALYIAAQEFSGVYIPGFYTAIKVNQNSVMPTNVSGNGEVAMIRGGKTAPDAYKGFRFYDGFMVSFIETHRATLSRGVVEMANSQYLAWGGSDTASGATRLTGTANGSVSLSGAGGMVLPILTAAPASPANGTLAYADGTSWNPGSGEGFYGRQAGAWVKL